MINTSLQISKSIGKTDQNHPNLPDLGSCPQAFLHLYLSGPNNITNHNQVNPMKLLQEKFLAAAILAIVLIGGCTKDQLVNPRDSQLKDALLNNSPDGTLDYFILPDSENYDAIPQGVGNPITKEKVALGKLLFFETGLALDAVNDSGKGTYSCATCHVPSAGFMPGNMQGIADGGFGFGDNGEGRAIQEIYEEEELDAQGARPLSLLNVAFVTNSTWSGKFGANGVNIGTEEVWDKDESTVVNHLGYDGLESQNMEGLVVHRMVINKMVADTLGYTAMYDAAFSDIPEEDRYSKLTTSFAISAYIRTLLTTEAPFQKWLKGESNALTEREKEGALLFYTKAGCFRCHKGAAMNAVEFHALGVRDLYEAGGVKTSVSDKRNLGRGGFTEREEDMYKFKVPQLYNMKDSPFYFHGSSKRSLRGVVEYFNRGEAENSNVPIEQISPFFHPLNMDVTEIDALVAFMENGLKDPNLDRFVPEEVLSGNCFPNNDPQSRADLGCN